MGESWFTDRWTSAWSGRYRAQGLWGDEVLSDYLDRAADERPDELCVADPVTRYTFAETRDRSSRLATGLTKLGVGRGDHVAVQLPNWADAVLTYFAIVRLGAVFVPRMLIYREHEVSDAVERTGSKVLVVPDEFRRFDHAAMALSVQARCPTLGHVVVLGDVPAGALAYESLLDHEPYRGPKPGADDPHLVLFTSGTTARPKGVVHSWNTYRGSAKGLVHAFRLTPDDICLMASPIMHNTGLLAGVVAPLLAMAGTVIQPVWEPLEAMALIDRFGCTLSVGATPFVTMMIDAHDPAEHDLSTFRLFACGGAPVPGAIVRQAVEVLGCKMQTVFGQSESSLQTITDLDDPVERVASSDGRAALGVDLVVLDEDGSEVPRGTEGEICGRGPGIMLGYLDDPEETAHSFEFGWFHSGDLARMDDEGYVRITGRKKDLIIRGGTNISAVEVESLIVEHPAVAEVSVVGMPDRVLGERMCAFVVPVAGQTVTLEELTQFLRKRKIAVQKLPERLEMRDALPLNATGKVEKFKLRDEIAGLLAKEGSAAR
jgi:non-ribosomal peptide synthetase component E (peptide arylation enzyme)